MDSSWKNSKYFPAVSIPDLNPEMLENLNSMQDRLDKAASPAAYIQRLSSIHL